MKRLDAAASAGFVIALYNPVSRARPWQLGDALHAAWPSSARHDAGDFRPRGGTRADESVTVTSLAEAPGIAADMATLVIVGSAETRMIARDGPSAAGLYAARRREGHRMIEPGKHILDRRDALDFRQRRALQHDHRKMQRARRGDLAVGRVAAAVLGDDARRCDGARAARDPLPR